MSIWEIIGGCLMLAVGIFIIIVVMLQESKQPGLSSSISGGMDYESRGRGKTSENISGCVFHYHVSSQLRISIL